jgi:uncharacterized protein (DUF1800 family)
MGTPQRSGRAALAILSLSLLLTACGGGGGSGGSEVATPPPAPRPEEPMPPVPEPLTEEEATRFLSQATFGPSARAVAEVMAQGLEAWFLAQLALPATLQLDEVLAQFPADGVFIDDNGNTLPGLVFLPSNAFWRNAVEAPDQLRQRMAFALSQILVVSADSQVGRTPQALSHYVDILARGAFGNYRDLLESVTYSPAMAIYLTYLRNEKADQMTGRVPDENYAREILQLFSIGVVALDADGSPRTDGQGGEVELYDNDDITQLARVFTGLSFAGAGFNAPLRAIPLEAFYTPLQAFSRFHSEAPKRFLGTTIPANTPPRESIDLALDAIFEHPNVGPFICRQLIQRFVTSAPEPAYVARVAAAFDTGSYTLPSGTAVGSGARGDLGAVIAAILFDEEARGTAARERDSFGKLREPVLRFTHWARAFEVNSADASNQPALRNTSSADALGQHPYLSPSVFNFYRPGYIAPGTATGAAGLTAPELQITNATSIVGYPNFLTAFAFEQTPGADRSGPPTFVPDYAGAIALASDTGALLDYLDGKLTHGAMTAATRERIASIIDLLDTNSEAGRDLRARVASVLVMTSPDYIVLR